MGRLKAERWRQGRGGERKAKPGGGKANKGSEERRGVSVGPMGAQYCFTGSKWGKIEAEECGMKVLGGRSQRREEFFGFIFSVGAYWVEPKAEGTGSEEE